MLATFETLLSFRNRKILRVSYVLGGGRVLNTYMQVG